MTTGVVLTIGHSNHTVEKFIDLLRGHNVTAIADVRSSPYSRFNPDFNREFLTTKLKERGITYIFLGRELGARSQDPACYDGGRVQYRKLAQTPLFKNGLVQLLSGMQTFRIALLCAEKEPLGCHRTLLIAQELAAMHIPVAHVLPNGVLESHADAMNRLLQILGISDQDLYRTREEIIADACALQEKRIAYVDKEMREEASA